MTNLLWIVGVLVVSVAGSLWHSIEEFARGLRALAPDAPSRERREERRSG